MTILIKWIFFLLLLGSCAHSSWIAENIASTKQMPFGAGRIYIEQSNFPGFSLEFFCHDTTIMAFLSITMARFIPLKNTDPSKIKIKYIIEEREEKEIEALLYKGNQRIAIDEETSRIFLATLRQKKQLFIEVDNFYTSIEGNDFETAYQKMHTIRWKQFIPTIF